MTVRRDQVGVFVILLPVEEVKPEQLESYAQVNLENLCVTGHSNDF